MVRQTTGWRARRQADLARIHIAVRELELDDDTYRTLLRDLTGKESAADLDARGRARLLGFFRQCGALRDAPPAPRPEMSRPGGHGQVRVLWRRLHEAGAVADGGAAALDRFVRNHTGVAGVARLAPDQARQVVAMLKGWLRRSRRRRGDRNAPRRPPRQGNGGG